VLRMLALAYLIAHFREERAWDERIASESELRSLPIGEEARLRVFPRLEPSYSLLNLLVIFP
jgi:hypothetical protein